MKENPNYTKYKKAYYLYNDIDTLYNQIDSKLEDESLDIKSKLIVDCKKLMRLLDGIDTKEFINLFTTDKVNNITKNISLFYEAADFIYRSMLGSELYDACLDKIYEKFKKITLHYKDTIKYSESKYDLAKAFTSALTKPSNIIMFKDKLKRIALGTMGLEEFTKIYEANRHMMSNQHKFK
jgi:hypothetical protein